MAKEAAKKEQPKGKTITIRQSGSVIGRNKKQQAVLVGLGLNKNYKVRTLKDTPEVRGMINKVSHLLEIVEEK